MMKRFLCAVAALVVLSASTFTFAEEPAAVAVEDPNTGAFTLSGGADWTTAYFFRGYNQEDQGLILQPYFTLTTELMKNDNLTLNGYVGTWNSFHSEKTGEVSGPGAWYENDLYGGLDLTLGKFTIGAIYTFYQYPNGVFESIQEVGLKVSYDDTDLMKKAGVNFALKPYAAIYLETDDGNGTEDTYAELGITPSFACGESGVTLSVPLVLGLSVDDYYLDDEGDNEVFGYGSVGLMASLPLKVPAKYGTWTLTGGVQYIHLFADSAENANDGGTEYEVLGKVGIAFSY